jgi:hypothetical protein
MAQLYLVVYADDHYSSDATLTSLARASSTPRYSHLNYHDAPLLSLDLSAEAKGE